MSKKDFIALADFIRWHNKSMVGEEQPFTAAHLDTLAQFCAAQSGQFKRGRWIDYIAGECGPNGGAVKKQTVELFRAGGWWHARYCNGPDRSKVIALFGTAEIPTAYRDVMTYDEVFALLRAIPDNAGVTFVEAGR